VTIYNGMREFMKHNSQKKMYILDEQQHAMDLCIYDGIMIQVAGLEGECISQMCQRTGSQRWHGRDRMSDWVLVEQCLGRCYGTLNGRL